jgi:hypothetical protein
MEQGQAIQIANEYCRVLSLGKNLVRDTPPVLANAVLFEQVSPYFSNYLLEIWSYWSEYDTAIGNIEPNRRYIPQFVGFGLLKKFVANLEYYSMRKLHEQKRFLAEPDALEELKKQMTANKEVWRPVWTPLGVEFVKGEAKYGDDYPNGETTKNLVRKYEPIVRRRIE